MRRTLLLGLVLLVPASAVAHPGRTDASGGHHDRKNGGYHYHGGGGRSPSAPSIATTPRTTYRTEANTGARTGARTEATEDAQTVYVTRTGSKYHRAGCRHLRSSSAMKLSEAVKKYSPCSVCKPPTAVEDEPQAAGEQPGGIFSSLFGTSGRDERNDRPAPTKAAAPVISKADVEREARLKAEEEAARLRKELEDLKAEQERKAEEREKAARNKLELAKKLVSRNRAAAKQWVQDVIKDYPGTEAAIEAAEFLKSL